MTTTRRTRNEQVRDLIMMCTLTIWLAFAVVSVVQVFTDGSKAIDSLLPFWFWGIPIAPYTALYAPWQIKQAVQGATAPTPPDDPTPEGTTP